MALTDRLMNDLRVRLPGATDAMIQREIWSLLNDFCREGLAWRENVEITLSGGVSTYAIAPAGTEVVLIYGVSHPTMDLSGAVYSFGNLLLTNEPSGSDLLSSAFVDAALTPALTAGSDVEGLIPGDMWSEHHEAILNGVLGRMLAQPAKPYSNPALAAFYVKSYTIERAVVRRKVRTGGVMAPQTWRYPRWAGRRGA
jgi:hypothetical protein